MYEYWNDAGPLARPDGPNSPTTNTFQDLFVVFQRISLVACFQNSLYLLFHLLITFY